ncbi:MAG: hypothetical protein JWM95_601 [Gemmatimonadetes bacterium]|nr:hypothetical protein [Gemmatimonadota bacterium]
MRDLFSTDDARRLALVASSAVFAALFEVVGVASILPFMGVISDPSALDRYEILQNLSGMLGAASVRDRLLLLGGLTGAAIVASNVVAASALWIQLRFVARCRSRLCNALFDAYLSQPYLFHTRRDAPSLLKVIYTDGESVVRLIGSALQFFSRLLVIFALLIFLVSRNPLVAFWTLGILGSSYALLYLTIRKRQEQLGKDWSLYSERRQRAAQEGLAGVKDIIVMGREFETSRRFAESTDRTGYVSNAGTLNAAMPRFLLEPLAFGGILGVALVILIRDPSAAARAIPLLALYAFVGYRLLPALQQVYTAAVEIRYFLPSLQALHADWVETHASIPRAFPHPSEAATRSSSSTSSLDIQGVSFRYPGATRGALANITLSVSHGESLGLVGRSGSGKSTLADLMLGLLSPDQGVVSWDGEPLSGARLRNWRMNVGYVPQSVFLSNASIAENIAFGLPSDSVDRTAVERAARLAQIESFMPDLPHGLDTVIGERGLKLSGGQRQRLGIARALYHDPELLIFDEATSALDGLTEDAVMQAIHALQGDRTVVLIAHRLRTVETCTRIALLQEGHLLAVGSYAELLGTSDNFRALVGQHNDQTAATRVDGQPE